MLRNPLHGSQFCDAPAFNTFFQPYAPIRASADVSPPLPVLLPNYCSLSGSAARLIVDVDSVFSVRVETCLELRVSDKIWEPKHGYGVVSMIVQIGLCPVHSCGTSLRLHPPPNTEDYRSSAIRHPSLNVKQGCLEKIPSLFLSNHQLLQLGEKMI